MTRLLADPLDRLRAVGCFGCPSDILQQISVLASPPDWLRAEMVLPVRIELTTSALPRMRSTTELRQHCPGKAAPMAVGRVACQPACPFGPQDPL